MSNHHARLIRSIFHDPPLHNLPWRDVESLLRHLGAEVAPLSGARVRATLGRAEAVLHRPHHHDHTLDRTGVVHLRGFLARAQITPSLYEGGSDAGGQPH